MADEPEETEELNEFGRTEEQENERWRAEHLTDLIEVLFRGVDHDVMCDAIAMFFRARAEKYEDPTCRGMMDVADSISDLKASARCGRNAIGVEIEPAYVRLSKERIERELAAIFRPATPVNHLSQEAALLTGAWTSEWGPSAVWLTIGQ